MLVKSRYKHFSDERLFASVKRGDATAFDELYQRYSYRLLHYLVRMLGGNEARAQDLLQDVFLKVIEKRALFTEARSFSSWIFTIACNRCKNEYRSRDIRSEVEYNETGSKATRSEFESDIFDQLEWRHFYNELHNVLKLFDDDQRSAFLLRFQDNMSISEIALIQNCPEGTVKSRLHYALKKIARYLKAFNPNASEVI